MTVDMCGECSQFEYSLQDFRHGFLSSSIDILHSFFFKFWRHEVWKLWASLCFLSIFHGFKFHFCRLFSNLSKGVFVLYEHVYSKTHVVSNHLKMTKIVKIMIKIFEVSIFAETFSSSSEFSLSWTVLEFNEGHGVVVVVVVVVLYQ